MGIESVPRLSWSEVCARRLARHGLSAAHAGPAAAVAAMAGTHAQVLSAAELAIGLRTADATRADVRTALWDEHTLVKTFGPRGTVHVLPTRDLPIWVAALSAVPASPSPFPEHVRMTGERTAQVIEAIGTALSDAELTVDELGEAVVEATGPWAGDLVMPAFQTMWPRWRQVMHLAGTRGVLCFGPNRGRKVTYTSPRRWLPGFEPAPERPALARTVRSYLHAYGPATPRRFAHWLGAPARWADDLFDSLAGELQRVEVEGHSAWVAAGDLDVPPEPPRCVRLLPYFDGYAYRVGNQPPELLYPGPAADRALRGNFQVLVVDGAVAGLWHQRRSGRHVDITVEPLVRLTAAQHDELGHQAERVGEILEARARPAIGTVTVGGHA
ncbi:winged helix DNA-binding protein [Actinoallomurus bryophytorum]|uniref:Winged helix DNA-binding protein n=1 Tax=Actinoallomurus bryophytorum TaxID=1490222 RepID=A0A543CPJ8_9ACTN|nr:winged helix DNA-binding domain-containing protein [Actinoallomurus bryophytorum]TQL99025.1 winged helix DNA-binding protein [Actinoallomurus bryophytorum]